MKIFRKFTIWLRRTPLRTDSPFGSAELRFAPVHYFTILLFIILSCAPSLYLPTEEQAEQTGIPLDELKTGRQLYIDHCGSCHMLYLPQQFTIEKWRVEMDSMRSKVTITDLEEKLILDYLLAGK